MCAIAHIVSGMQRPEPDAADLLPLPTTTFHILMALADDDRHGYAIIQDVADRTGGEVTLSAGTLYRSIQRLLEQGLIEELTERPAPELDDERRRYYRITAVRPRRGEGGGRAPGIAAAAGARQRLPDGQGVMRAYRLLLRLFPKSFRHEYRQRDGGDLRRRQTRCGRRVWAITLLWLETIVETVRDACGVHADLLRQDVGYATRTLIRARGFAVTSILVTALGVGATTAVFSVADHVLVRPLPFPDSTRLVKLWQDDSLRGYSRLRALAGQVP